MPQSLKSRRHGGAELERRAVRFELLADTAAGLLLNDDPQELLESLFLRASSHLGLEIYFHFLASEDGSHLTLASCAGIPAETLPQLQRLEMGQAVCGLVAARRSPMTVEDVQARDDERTELIRSLGITAYSCHVLIARGRLLGTLSFGTRRRPRFEPEELELMQSLCDLVAAAVERSRLIREAQEARQAAEAASHAKDEFLATLSHELRTPLTPVLLTIQAMEADPRLPPDLHRHTQVLRRNIELEVRLIDDLLDVTRIARGKIQLQREGFDLHRMLRDVVDTCCAQAAGRAPRIDFALAAARSRVDGDESRLRQVICNLLSNAIKFTPPGGPIVVRTADEPPDRIRIEVIDSGIGIDPWLLPHIFDAFEQGGSDVTRRFGGLGLGLAISRSLVELHGGTLQAASGGPGQGATFTVRLPLGLELPGEAAPAADLSLLTGAGRPRKILLVEDHRDTAEALAELLRLRGHQVTVAAGMAEARAALRADANGAPPFDLVVSDLGLPDGSGLDLMREIASEHGIPGIALSGYGTEEDVRGSRNAGFHVHLTKPVRREALEAAIERTMEGAGQAAG